MNVLCLLASLPLGPVGRHRCHTFAFSFDTDTIIRYYYYLTSLFFLFGSRNFSKWFRGSWALIAAASAVWLCVSTVPSSSSTPAWASVSYAQACIHAKVRVVPLKEKREGKVKDKTEKKEISRTRVKKGEKTAISGIVGAALSLWTVDLGVFAFGPTSSFHG